MNLNKLEISIEIDYAPKKNGKAFDKWCGLYGFVPLGSSRRAWCGELNTYFRNAVGVADTQGGEVFLIYPEDLK